MVPLDILNKICFINFHPDGHLNTESIISIQNWAYKKGYIDSKVTLDQLIDMSFAEYASSVLDNMEQ